MFLGVEPSTELALQYTKKTGVYTVISDFRFEDSDPVKKLADEVWKIDLKDMERLESVCLLFPLVLDRYQKLK